MRKSRIFNPTLILVCCLFLKCGSVENNKIGGNPIYHAQNFRAIVVPQTKHKIPSTNGQHQIVTYTTSLTKWSFLNFAWEEYIVNHPEIDFIFYYSGADTVALKEWLSLNKFSSPVLFDIDGEFKRDNIKDKKLTSISFVVKKGSIIDFSNPSQPDFEKVLRELLSQD
ncbi:hypothetical protein [Rhodonellum sp.]|uniref:hypothetical protein n=1 Tax=Rhodonellum sp. TaxID=2231180 RepID=UPI00271ACC51|nr:hypothetical protein [Rhodonellum sp.]MDO9554761.1 hypothetical protein [Rhodonellum sp.]